MAYEELPRDSELNITEFLMGLQKRLQAEIPTPEDARALCDELNNSFKDMQGNPIEIICGATYIVGDGVIRGAHISTGRDLGDRPNTGRAKRGIFQRFDVLENNDELITRGTIIEIPEPSLVYLEDPPLVHFSPAADITEIYAPILRLGKITKLAE